MSFPPTRGVSSKATSTGSLGYFLTEAANQRNAIRCLSACIVCEENLSLNHVQDEAGEKCSGATRKWRSSGLFPEFIERLARDFALTRMGYGGGDPLVFAARLLTAVQLDANFGGGKL